MPQFELIAGAKRSIEDLCRTSQDREPGGNALHPIEGRLVARSVGFAYAGSKRLFSDLSIVIEPRSLLAITGANGTGKSTLAKLLAGAPSPTAGEIVVDGVNLNAVQLESYRKQISVVLQNAQIFPGTLRDNITLKEAQDPEVVATVVRRLGLDVIASRLPMGLDSTVGNGGVALSGGERQRVVLARALVRRPRVLFFDELTNHLDAMSVSDVCALLRDLKGSCTMVVVSHHEQVIRLADRVLRLERRTDGIAAPVEAPNASPPFRQTPPSVRVHCDSISPDFKIPSAI